VFFLYLFIYFRIPCCCSGNLHELIFLNISTCKFFIASKYGDFCAFPPPPPREPLYREADFRFFVDPKMPFIDFTGRLFNFVFLSPKPCEIFARKKKLKKLKKRKKKEKLIPCLPEWKYNNNNNNNNNNNTLGVT